MKKAFTLIELLIVVAIIAILAAIAVPNFLEAQVRSKVSRAMADIRSLATAVEAYAVDNNKYPIDGNIAGDGQPYWYIPGGPGGVPAGMACGVTSPIAYITSGALVDPFRTMSDGATARLTDVPDGLNFTDNDYRRFRYTNGKYTYGPLSASLTAEYLQQYGDWRLNSSGPDRTFGPTYVPVGKTLGVNVPYDPTNGTVSSGDIVRTQKESKYSVK
ncbi:MAG: type II secretion system protein GspG [Candidatus Sumerlaeaceae bacterium]|nr:type II secretion system protein GspG [Candidatus Sumerlaeaceae bacterium]